MSLIGPSVLITDCANVKFMHEMSRDDQTLFKRMYAGVFLQLLNRPERHLIDEVRKVKAHQSLNEEGLSQGEYALRLGNHSADLGAKEALAFHPRDEEVLEETDLSVKIASCRLQTCC